MNVVKSRNFEEQKEKGICVCCNELHTYIHGKYKVEMVDFSLGACKKFRKMTPKDRAIMVKDLKACAYCLDRRHERPACLRKKVNCKVKESGQECGLQHHNLLHGTNIGYVNTVKSFAVNLDCEDKPANVLLHVVRHVIKERNLAVVIFADDGSD